MVRCSFGPGTKELKKLLTNKNQNIQLYIDSSMQASWEKSIKIYIYIYNYIYMYRERQREKKKREKKPVHPFFLPVYECAAPTQEPILGFLG